MADQLITNYQLSNSGSTNGQVLTSNGSAVIWSTIVGVNTAAQYTFSNSITFSNTVTITGGLNTNMDYGLVTGSVTGGIDYGSVL